MRKIKMPKFVNVDDMNFVFHSVYMGTDEDKRDVFRRTEIAFKSDIDEIPAADVVSRQEYDDIKTKLETAEKCIYGIRDILAEAIENPNDNRELANLPIVQLINFLGKKDA
jgi:hypothetical protein